MIALPAGLPLIRINELNLAVCDPEWLQGTLRAAARDTDVPPWLMDDVGRGVESYLRNHFHGTVIDVDDLFARIRETLNNLGLKNVSDRLDAVPPGVRISLTDLARRAGDGYELAFFQLLESRFRSAAGGGARELNCYGLERCVRHLASAERWTARCEKLRLEIVAFLHHEQARAITTFPKLRLSVRN